MNNCLTTQALQEYINSLEKELKTKSIEQETLYRALEASEKELSTLDELYFFKSVLTNQVNTLKQELENANRQREQMNETNRELQWARTEIVRLSNGLRAKDFQQSELEEVYEENEELLKRVQSLQNELSQERSQKDVLRCQNKQLQTKLSSKKKEIGFLQQKLETLSQNYIKVEQEFFEKDRYLEELTAQNEELRTRVETLKQQMGQKNIMINCLQSQLQEAKLTFRSQSQSPLQNLLEGIDKFDLIKQTNDLIERVHVMQRENRGFFVQENQKTKNMQSHLQDLKEEFSTLSSHFEK